MIDHWFGLLLDAIDASGGRDDTAVIVCTTTATTWRARPVGQAGVPAYAPLGHVPLLVRWPGVAPGECGALTTTVDLHATLCDQFGVTSPQPTHGRSLLPLLTGERESVRRHVLGGVWAVMCSW